jgi:pSer/pThr/pTyr-binding forkhead associated (FHA) protein
VTVCAFCGRVNDANSRFCIDCGKPTSASAARVTPAIGPLTPPQPLASSGAMAGVAVPAGAGGGALPGPAGAPAAMAANVGANASAGSGAGSGAGGGAGTPLVPPTRVSSPASAAPGYGPRGTPALMPCPHCRAMVNSTLPFCSHCGKRTGLLAASGPACASCGAPVRPGVDLFCGRCGSNVGDGPGADATAPATGAGSTMVLGAVSRDALPKLALLDEAGEIAQTYTVERGELIIGRADGDIRFPDDVYLSPIHALFAFREGALWVRDLGSRNGTWVFAERAFRLTDGDVILVGSQLLRFRRLGYPGPHPPEADATRRLGSLVPSADVAVLQQLRADGSVRDTLHLSPGRNAVLGREQGDWVFPYDQTMSGRHAEIRSEDSEFVVHDLGSRNGVALSTRGERKLERGTRVLVGDQILRLESF